MITEMMIPEILKDKDNGRKWLEESKCSISNAMVANKKDFQSNYKYGNKKDNRSDDQKKNKI